MPYLPSIFALDTIRKIGYYAEELSVPTICRFERHGGLFLMRDKVLTIVLSALVSAVVTFLTITFLGQGERSLPGHLALKTLEVTESITIKSPEKADEAVVLRNDGLVFAKGKVITEHFLGKQFSGHLLLGNRIMVSPNDLANDPPETLQFLGELGVNSLTGSGELLIRSPQGGNRVGSGAEEGQFAQISFDQYDSVRFFVYDNLHQETLPLVTSFQVGDSTAERSPVAPPIAGPPITISTE